MALVLQHNGMSKFAARQQVQHSNSLSTSFERLSTGLRINGAKDDSAGLSISTRMESQILSYQRRVHNAQDAISFTQTTEGVLSETEASLQRMRELSVQSGNQTLNLNDLEAIQLELEQLKAEITKNNGQTFNDLNVFGDQRNFFISEDANQNLGVRTREASSKHLGKLIRSTSATSVNTALVSVSGDISIFSDDVTTSIRGSNAADDQLSTSLKAGSAIAKAAAINAASKETGVIAITEKTQAGSTKLSATTLTSSTYIKINGAVIAGFNTLENDADSQLKNTINEFAIETGVIATHDSKGFLILTAEDGRNIEIEVFGAATLLGFQDQVIGGRLTLQSEDQFEVTFQNNANLALGEVAQETQAGGSTVVKIDEGQVGVAVPYDNTAPNSFFNNGGLVNFSGNFTGAVTEVFEVFLNGSNLFLTGDQGNNTIINNVIADGVYTAFGIDIEITNLIQWDNDGTADNRFDAFTFEVDPGAVVFGEGVGLFAETPLSVDTIDVTYEGGSDDALYVLDFAIKEISTSRATLGAIQNRLEATIRNLNQGVESLSIAQSRIQDADFAHETAQLTQTQIIQQASVSLLAQANQMPSIALQLLT
jgi:flagellin